MAGAKGKLYVVDMTNRAVIATVALQGANITSLAVAGDWLYAAEGWRYGGGTGNYQLQRLNINPDSPDFLIKRQTIALPPNPSGYLDLAVSAGRYLAITAPAQPPGITIESKPDKGNLYILDLKRVDAETGAYVPEALKTVTLQGLSGNNTGKGPQYITAGARPGEFLVGTSLSPNNGLVGIHFDRDKQGNLTGEARLTQVELKPKEKGWLFKKHQQNIQRTHGVVYTSHNGVEYALVADFNLIFDSPHFNNPDTLWGKQIGGKIGIVKDPFGTPQYLGATTPISGGMLDRLSLSPDGRVLYASAWIDEPGAPGSGIHSIFYQSLLVWDAEALIQAALDAHAGGLPTTQPIDLRKSGSLGYAPVPGAQPSKYDGPSQNERFGFLYGQAAQPLGNVVNLEVTGRYGDVLELNLKDKLCNSGIELRSKLEAGLAKLGLTLPADNELEFEMGPRLGALIDVAKINTLIDGKEQDTILSKKDKTFEESGVFYLFANLDTPVIKGGRAESSLDKLRRGEALDDTRADFLINLQAKDRTGAWVPVQIKLTARIQDYGRDPRNPSPFFGDRPLDNPGYSEFTLDGAVGIGQKYDPRDVFKVEQRLKYLGFPAMGYGITNASNNNAPITFDTDGRFEEKEQRALKLFEKVVRYTAVSEQGTAVTKAGKDVVKTTNGYAEVTVNVTVQAEGVDASVVTDKTVTADWTIKITKQGLTAEQKVAAIAELEALRDANKVQIEAAAVKKATQDAIAAAKNRINLTTRFENDVEGADGLIEGDKNNSERQRTINWLNAYNAPHWIQLFTTRTTNPNLPGWYNSQTHNQKNDPDYPNVYSNVETYGTSWLRDLMRAREFAPDSLRPVRTQFGSDLITRDARFNGAVDGNHGYTPFGHNTHDMGMAFDLGVKDFISDKNQQRTDEPRTIPIVDNSGWSLSNALTLSGDVRLPNWQDENKNNFQQDALRDFLSLYWVTREDLAAQIRGDADKVAVQRALFRSGAGGIIPMVIIGGEGSHQNSYENMQAVLTNLGISNKPVGGHHNHFHVFLKPPALQPIRATQQLQADASANPTAVPQGDAAMPLIYYAPDILSLTAPPALVAQADAPQIAWGGNLLVTREKGYERVFTSCQDAEGGVGIPVLADVLKYLGIKYDGKTKSFNPPLEIKRDVKIAILEAPRHGRLVESRDIHTGEISPFGPDYVVTQRTEEGLSAYTGKDRVVFEVDVKGRKFKVVVNLYVAPTIDDRFGAQCERMKFNRLDTPDTGLASFSSTGVGERAEGASGISVSVAPLTDLALAQTIGHTITLDDNAAGHDWYIDLTPGLNEEFLPTSNPYEWKARPGSEAEGKMDLLTVLLHEAGHALGLEHTADAHGLMAATLQPGVRRLPSLELLAALSPGYTAGEGRGEAEVSASIAGQGDAPTPNAPLPLTTGLTAFWLGRLRRGAFGQTLVPADNANASDAPRYAVAANATLTNPEFAGGTAWSARGTVTFGNGAATLTESATAQTRLDQLFTIGDTDRFLRFTLSDIALDNVNPAPDDAFEVSLIDANTGVSLLGGTGLSRSDAALNLQADGTEHLAPGITRTFNADGSRSYLIDLTGIAPGTVADLSFDLIGRA